MRSHHLLVVTLAMLSANAVRSQELAATWGTGRAVVARLEADHREILHSR